MIDETDRNALSTYIKKLTREDLSTVVASLDKAEGQIGTSKTGAMFDFCMKLVELKAADEIPLLVDLPPSVAVTSFKIREDAKAGLRDLISSIGP